MEQLCFYHFVILGFYEKKTLKANGCNGLLPPSSAQSSVSDSYSTKSKLTILIWAANPDPTHLGASSPLANECYEPVNNSPSCSWKQLALMSSLDPQGPPQPEGKGKRN